ncbi:MAG: hypothetical protein F6K30_03800 [Cyanothece sp. SIO2G6]|nr:hypothetical protein [Cyanothece sp. SIO2G6]
MISNFDNDGSSNTNDQSAANQRGFASLDNLKRDRFELLSAYMDGEVTALEKRQVEQWLVEDQNFRCLYGRLCKLRRGFKTMPVPVSSQISVDETIAAVCQKVDRRPQMILAAAVGTVITVLAASFVPPIRVQFANWLKEMPQPPAESLEINLNVPISTPESLSSSEPQSAAMVPDTPELGIHSLGVTLDTPIVAIPDGDRPSTAE